MINRLTSLSIAVWDIDEALPPYLNILGLEPVGERRTSDRGFDLHWQALGHGEVAFLELIAPIGDDGPIAKFLKRYGEGVYQIRLEADRVETTLDEIEARGGRVIRDRPPGPDRNPLGWIHPSTTHGVLVEVVEEG